MEYTGYNTIYDYLKNVDIPDGIHSMQLANDEIIDFEVYNYLEDIEFDETPILGDNIPDTKMLILKFHKNLTINAGVTITPQVRKKGMTIYCNGTIENNGTISMTARGANAVGQDVLLYQNANGSYEFVPKVGGAGINGGTAKNQKVSSNGINGINRQTGGGGFGSIYVANNNIVYYGGSGSGTSYSGGAASGSVDSTNGNYGTYTANNAARGLLGGHGSYRIAGETIVCTGGAGITSGNTARTGSMKYIENNEQGNGTGGLLIIYAINLYNYGNIQSNGTDAKSPSATLNGNWAYFCGGGGSGGGSINIFSKVLILSGNIEANGGLGTQVNNIYMKASIFNMTPAIGGNGGNGSITLTDISTRYYLIKNNDRYLYYLNNKWNILDHKPTKKDFINYGVYNLSIIPTNLLFELSREVEFILCIDICKDININIKAIPKEQVIVNKNSLSLPLTKSIKSMLITNNVSETENISTLISVNRSATWLYFDNGWKVFNFINPPPTNVYTENNFEWQNWINNMNIDDIKNIKTLGLKQQQLSSGGITQEQWEDILSIDNYHKNIMFINLMCGVNYTDIIEINKISIIQDKYGYYKENRNYNQRQETNKLIIIPQFNSQQIKINYTL